MANRTATTSTERQGRQGGPMGASTQALSETGMAAPDHLYGVVSVLYHALQGEQTYQQYIEDARKANDTDLQQFFEECRTEEHERAQRAKSLLLDRLEDEDEESEGDEESEEDDEDEDDEDEE